MAALHVIMVFLASGYWIYLLSGVSREQQRKTVITQEGKGTAATESIAGSGTE